MKILNALFILCLLTSSCNQPKKKLIVKRQKEAGISYFGNESKKIDIHYIVGKWHVSSMRYSEYGTDSNNVSMFSRTSKNCIPSSNWVPIEFTSNHKLIVNRDTVGKWYEKNHLLILEKKMRFLSFPLFLNKSYTVGQGRFSGFLTCYLYDRGKLLHEVKYIILKDK